MIERCAILVALAAGVLLVLAIGVLLARWARTGAAKPDDKLCAGLCRLRVGLGIVLGFAAGLFFAFCRHELRDLLSGKAGCLRTLFLLLLLALLLAFLLAALIIVCGLPASRDPKATGLARWGILGLVLALAAAVLILLVRACHQPLGVLLAAPCARWLLFVIAAAILFLIALALEVRFCPRPPPRDCARRLRVIAGLLAVTLAWILVVIRTCDDLGKDEHELAMIGIHWDGKHTGEVGAHLRWGFAWGLPFPQNGFDLYRRPAGGGSWTLLNAEGRVHPIRTWDGTVPGGPVWKGRGKDRLPAPEHGRFEGANADQATFLLDMVARAPYQTLYYVEGSDTPFLDETSAKAFADAAGEPRVQWQVEPMSLLQTMALHPEIARLLGLYWIDETADPDTAYDYRVVGYWSDRSRAYVVTNLSRTTTAPLPAPALLRADPLPSATRELPGGAIWPTQAYVGLGWTPPTPDPEQRLGLVDGIRAVAYAPERQDLGRLSSPSTPVADGWVRLPGPDEDGAFRIRELVVPSARTVEGQPPEWPEHFTFDEWVEYHAYAYRVMGVDLFGRTSAPSNELHPVLVSDTVPAPAPTHLEARLFQRGDPTIPADQRAVLFPTDADRVALRVSWLWPDDVDRAVPDLKEFQILHLDGPSETALGVPVPRAAGVVGPLPPRFGAAAPPARYFEVTLTQGALPGGYVTAMTADDDRPTASGQIVVRATDHDDFNNVGPATPPVLVVARDFDPPPAPSPPVQDGEPIVDDAYAAVPLRVDGADLRYTYELYRLNAVELAELPAGGPLPAPCVESPDPIRRDLQRRAHANPAAMKLVSTTPASAAGTPPRSTLGDRVDAAVGQRLVYAARAVDPAGNRSVDLSCPSLPVDTPDAMAPAAPVVTSVVGAESSIVVTWVKSRETDLERYELYRTSDTADTNSKRKMTRVLVADSLGHAISPTGAADATAIVIAADRLWRWVDQQPTGGLDYHYRLVAVDTTGNASEMSASAVGRAIDTTPPTVPAWLATGAGVRSVDIAGAPIIVLTWQVLAGDADGRFIVQRRAGTSAAWTPMTSWFPGITWVDDTVEDGVEYRYRLRAMDRIGNRNAGWSDELVVPP